MKRCIQIICIAIFLSSCSERYSQHYSTYDQFDAANGRNKGWFPKLIPEDAFQLKNDSFLSKNLTFSSYQYENQKHLDSIRHALNYIEVSEKDFRMLLTETLESRPLWFISIEELDLKNYTVYKLNRENVLIDPKRKLVFCIARSNHLS